MRSGEDYKLFIIAAFSKKKFVFLLLAEHSFIALLMQIAFMTQHKTMFHTNINSTKVINHIRPFFSIILCESMAI